MTLIHDVLQVSRLRLGDAAGWVEGELTLDAEALRGLLCREIADFSSVRVAVTHPGDQTRVLCVKDVVQPRCKFEPAAPGEGRTLVLDGAAVVTCGPIVGFQEGIIDMSGPGAAYSPFSRQALLVLEIEARPDIEPHAHEAALRRAGLLAAEHLARLCAEVAPGRSEIFDWPERAGSISVRSAPLPRLGYLCMVLSQGLLHDTYVLGQDAHSGLPMIVDPRVILDGGIVSGNCVSACDKNTTWHHQNNPLVKALLAGHGKRWDFAGVVVSNCSTRLAQKQVSAERAVALMRQLDPGGVVVSKEGFGNPDADLMMLLRGLEQAGIRAVGLTDEFAGGDGASQSLADTAGEADAIVSTGNANERIVLPPMARTIGPLPDAARLAGGYPHSLRDDGSLEVELQALIGATNQLGSGRLYCAGL